MHSKITVSLLFILIYNLTYFWLMTNRSTDEVLRPWITLNLIKKNLHQHQMLQLSFLKVEDFFSNGNSNKPINNPSIP